MKASEWNKRFGGQKKHSTLPASKEERERMKADLLRVMAKMGLKCKTCGFQADNPLQLIDHLSKTVVRERRGLRVHEAFDRKVKANPTLIFESGALRFPSDVVWLSKDDRITEPSTEMMVAFVERMQERIRKENEERRKAEKERR